MAARRKILFHWSFLLVAALIPLIEWALPGNHRVGDLLRPIFIMAMLGLGLNILTGFTGLLNLGVAAFMAAASVRTSKFCERCNRYMVELQPKPANATSLKDLVTAISGANWHECATLLQVTTAETGGEVTFARCPQCNDTYCELTVKIKAA